MKLSIVFLLFQIISYGQNIHGKWELISYQNDKIFYNVVNDSLFPKDHWIDDEDMVNIIKKAFKDTSIEFTQKNHFIMKSFIVGDKNSRYILDSENNLIILDEVDINNEKISYNYSLLNDVLIFYLTEGLTLKFRRNQ